LEFEIGPVRDQDNLELPEFGMATHLPDQECHRQALARALCVPDNPASAVDLSVACLGIASQEPVDRLVDAPVLLVPADYLHSPTGANLHEQSEVSDDVEQPLRRQHPCREEFLLGDRLNWLPQ